MTDRSFAVIFAGALVLVSTTPLLAHEPAEFGSPPNAASPEEALARDTAAYAATLGISHEQAATRLGILTAFPDRLQMTEQASGGRFAGAWIEHAPELRLVIRFTGRSSLPAAATEALSAIPGRVDVELGALHSFDQLRKAQDKITPLLHASLPAMSFGVNAQTGAIELRGPVHLSAEEIQALSAAAGVPVTITEAPRLERAHTYGGRHIAAGNGSCTTGFSSVDAVSGTKGVLTAGHCAGSTTAATYYQTSTLSYGMTLGGKRWDRNQDFAWYREAAHVVYPLFFDGSVYRDVLGTTTRSRMQGQPVCHYGITTGYSCGFVINVNYNPGGTYCNGGPCDSVWVAIDGSSQKCWFGDSGGPYFWGNVAWGLYSGQAATGPGSGQCAFAIMMSVEALAFDGVNTRVYVAPGGVG